MGKIDINITQQPSSTTGVNGETDSITISPGNTIPITHPPAASVTTTTVTKLMGFAGGAVQGSGLGIYNFNSTVSRTAVGRYTVNFFSPHPSGANYNISLTTASDNPNRDQRKIGYLNKTANSFQVITTVDDNGGSADGFADIGFDYTVFEEVTVVNSVT